MNRMTRIALALALLIATGNAAAVGWVAVPAGAATDQTTTLDARLGGTMRSFEARYGPVVATNDAIGAEFAVAGFGLVAVQFDRTTARYAPDDPALVIVLRAPRPAALDASAPDPADWTLSDARQRARDFLPVDATLGKTAAIDDHTLAADCASPSLEAAFGVVSLGQCRVTFLAPTPQTVSFVTLTTTAGAAAVPPAPATPVALCAGVVAWAQTAGAQMAAAGKLLDRVRAIPDGDPNATGTLRDVAAAFDRLAATQRAAAAPPVAAKASYFLIAAFAAYARAASAAADGVATGAADRLDDAARGIAEANADIVHGTEAIRQTFADCRLTPGTPAAGALSSAM